MKKRKFKIFSRDIEDPEPYISEVDGELVTLQNGGRDFFIFKDDGRYYKIGSLRYGLPVVHGKSKTKKDAIEEAERVLQNRNYKPGEFFENLENGYSQKGIKLPLNEITETNKSEQSEPPKNKIPVFTKNYSGTKPIVKKIHAEPYEGIDNVWVSEPDDRGFIMVIVRLEHEDKSAFVDAGLIHEDAIKDRLNQEIVDRYVERYWADLHTGDVTDKDILVAGHLGFHLETLMARKVALQKKIEEERTAAADKKKREKEMAQSAALDKAEKDLLGGEVLVDGEYVIQLCKRYGVEISIRTIGAIRSNGVSFIYNPKENNFQYKSRKYKIANADFFFSLIEKIKEKQENPKSQSIALAKAKAAAIKIKLKLLRLSNESQKKSF